METLANTNWDVIIGMRVQIYKSKIKYQQERNFWGNEIQNYKLGFLRL